MNWIISVQVVKVYFMLCRIDSVKVYQDHHVIVTYNITFLFALSQSTSALLLLHFHITGVLIFK